MHQIEIPAKGLKLTMPANVNECNQRQYILLLNNYQRLAAGALPIDEFLPRLAHDFLNLKRSNHRPTDQPRIAENLARLAELLKEFLIVEAGRARVNITTIKQHFARHRVNNYLYIGTADALTSWTFGQYVLADAAHQAYTKTEAPEHLHTITALVYRRASWRQLWRKPSAFSAEAHAREVAQAASLPEYMHLAALNLYQSTLEWWAAFPIEINGKEVDLSILFAAQTKKKRKGKPDPTGMAGLLYTLAESQVFGNTAETAKAGLYDVFLRLVQLHHQSEEINNKKK